MQKSRIIKQEKIEFDNEEYILEKKEVNVANNNRTTKVFIRKC